MNDAGRCLVTGADGFIGSALIRRLRGEYGEVWRLVRPAKANGTDEPQTPLTVTADLSRELPALARFEVIFHLAGRVHAVDSRRTEEEAHHGANVEGTRNLLAAAARSGSRRVVFTSSVAVMGASTRGCVDESALPAPVTAYGRTKLRAEQLVLAAAASGGPEGVVLRLPLVYGSGQKGNLARMLRAIERRRFPPPPRSAQKRSVVHVEDVAEALVTAGRHPAAAGKVFLVCEPEATSTRAIWDSTRTALGRSPISWGIPAPALRALGRMGDLAAAGLGRRVPFDSSGIERVLGDAWFSAGRIERDLGFLPRRRFADELPRLVDELARRGGASGGAR